MELVFPDLLTLGLVERERMDDLARSTVFGQMFPFGSQAGEAVTWDRLDSLVGTMPGRTPGEPLQVLNPRGLVRKSIPASYFGAQMPLDLKKVIGAGQPGTLGQKLNLTEELNRMNTDLAFRERQTIDYQLSALALRGDVPIFDDKGTVVKSIKWEGHSDQIEVLGSGDEFSNLATSDPIKVLRSIGTSRYRGSGYSYINGVIYVSQRGANVILSSDAIRADLKGRFGSSTVTLDMFNDAFRGSLPRIEIVEDGVHLADGNWQPLIEDHKMLIVGSHVQRGTRLGEWTITTNEQMGVGENIYANVRMPNEFPANPIVERALQGAPNLYGDKQLVVVEFADPNDILTF